MKHLVLGLSVFVGLNLAAAGAHAGSRAPVIPAHTMSCETAVNFYEKYKRIYVLANGKDIVPIYGMTPVRQRATIRCTGRGKQVRPYWVRTNDTNTCIIAAHCR